MFNQSIFMGRLTRDAETKFLQGSNSSVTKFCIAVDRDYIPAGKDKPDTDFFDCEAWNNTGEFVAKHFRKGSMILVIGSVEKGSYIDKDGKKIPTITVKVNKARFTGEKTSGNNQPQPSPDDFMPYPDDMDEPPFR